MPQSPRPAPYRGSAPARRELASLLDGYRPFPDVFDEMMNASGQLRDHWIPFLDALAEMGPAEIDRRFASANRSLRDSGVFYRIHDDPAGNERPWPLSHIPLILDTEQWKTLAAGLIERAGLIEYFLKD